MGPLPGRNLMNDPGVRGWSGQPRLTPGHVSPWGYLASFEMNGVSKGLLASAHHYVFLSPSANSANIWKNIFKNGVLTGLSLIPFFLHAFEWHGARQKTSTDLKLKATQEFAVDKKICLTQSVCGQIIQHLSEFNRNVWWCKSKRRPGGHNMSCLLWSNGQKTPQR